jgi:hypothetical protein
MKKTDKHPKGYNEKNPVQPEGSIDKNKSDESRTYPSDTTPNEKLSIPERKLKKVRK